MNSIPWVSGPLPLATSVLIGRCGPPNRLPTSPIPPDHRARTLEIPGSSDPNIIPDGDFSSLVRVTGGSALQSVPRAASDSCEAHRPLLDPLGPQTCSLTLAPPFPL